jgi:hypothetical protein
MSSRLPTPVTYDTVQYRNKELPVSDQRPRYAVFVLLAFEPAWLALPRERRREVAAALQAIVGRHPEVHVRWFDADAFGRGYTDFVLCECNDLERYHFLWEELRDSVLFTTPYARLVDVVLGLERGYQRFEASLAAAG